MFKKIICSAFALLTLAGTPAVFGWGQKGHDVVAAIAERNLNSKARQRLDKLLAGRSLVYYASWLDNVQNSPYWNDGYNRTKSWHIANVDKGFTYQTMTKNERGDLLTAMTMLTDQLTNNYANLTDSMRTEYTYMIIHLVGDMHCPMHTGYLTDLGGNLEKVRWFGQNTNLHSVWDSRLVESAHAWSHTEWCEELDRTSAAQRTQMTKGSYEDWLNETVEASRKIYASLATLGANPNLSYQYVYDFTPLVEHQLLAAGYRLASVLNNIFGR